MMFLDRFTKKLPGKTYPKKLFFWNLIQFSAFLLLVIFVYPSYALILENFEVAKLSHWLIFFFYVPTSELFAFDNPWGDFLWTMTGVDWRGIWMITRPLILFITYLWAFRNRYTAKLLRTGNFIITASAFIIYTVFFPMNSRYDYYIWYVIMKLWNFSPAIILIAIISIFFMWFGAIISNGYIIYKAWKEEKS